MALESKARRDDSKLGDWIVCSGAVEASHGEMSRQRVEIKQVVIDGSMVRVDGGELRVSQLAGQGGRLEDVRSKPQKRDDQR